MSFLVSEVLAQDVSAVAQPAKQPFDMFLMVGFIFIIFYFLLIRPQQRSAKQHKDMIGGLKRGDKVVTGGGILGTITKVESDDVLMVEIAPGTVVQVARGTLISVVSTDAVTVVEKKQKSRKADSATTSNVANDN